MRIPRVYVSTALTANSECELPEDAAHHVHTVLRLRIGAELIAFDGQGGEYPGEVTTVHRRGVSVRLGAWRDVERESSLNVTLLQGISRGERMDYTLQKAVELGVSAIVPVITERTVVNLKADRVDRRLGHWQRIISTACEQCGRNRVPPLRDVVTFDYLLNGEAPIAGLLLVGNAPDGLPEWRHAVPPISLMVGPEGGLSELEQQRAVARGYQPVRLGPRVLRTETAALTALAVLQSRYGDLS